MNAQNIQLVETVPALEYDKVVLSQSIDEIYKVGVFRIKVEKDKANRRMTYPSDFMNEIK